MQQPWPEASLGEAHAPRRLPGVDHRVHVAPLRDIPELRLVQRVATSRALPQLLETHRHQGIEITFLERGRLEWCTDERTDQLCGGEVLVTWAGEVHGPAGGILGPCILHTLQLALWDAPQAGAAGFLGLPMPESMLLVHALRNLRSRHFAAPSGMAARLTRLLDCLDGRGRMTPVRARAMLLELLLAVVDASACGEEGRANSHLVTRALDLIDEHLTEPLEMSRLARDLGCSVSHLATRFRSEMGIPPAQYHLRRRIGEASRRLLSADSITEIAFDLGFASSQHFTTAFRRVTGMAPRQYRRSLSPAAAAPHHAVAR
ncbi:MAG TPA: AraC family transcriptional regulator [Candidatus Dormibacteraeota bacterium]|nr:AraC family transcriptional regulator [Candidatus Dormibacteraeota bacterium]